MKKITVKKAGSENKWQTGEKIVSVSKYTGGRDVLDKSVIELEDMELDLPSFDSINKKWYPYSV